MIISSFQLVEQMPPKKGCAQNRMKTVKTMKIDANGTEIRVMGDVVNEDAFISLTDIAKYKNPITLLL